MYMIINYDRYDRYPKVFDTYQAALKIFKKLNDNTNTLEKWDIKLQKRTSIIDRRKKIRKFNKYVR